MNKRRIILLLVSCFLLQISPHSMASPAKTPIQKSLPGAMTPIQAIKDLDKLVDQYRVGKNLSAADQEFNRQLKQKILRGTFDLSELAKLALDKYWNQRTPQEQSQFVELLTSLLEERSVFAKEKAVEKGADAPYSIHYKSQDYLNKEKTNALAKTIVRLKKKNIKVELDYKLRKTLAQEWKIYDVIMDGASLVDNYRYSFGNIISKQGYPELVRRMQNKLAEFRSKRT